MATPSRAGPSLVAILLFGVTLVGARDLTFEERVNAQEVLERVYYSHQIGSTRPFEQTVPRGVLETKVRTYLKQTVAMEKFWKTPVTGRMLQAETERMARQTRMPERLLQLFAFLGDDPFLAQECLARPVLVNRLSRNFFAYDATIHAGPRNESEALRRDLASGRLDPWAEHPRRTLTDLVRIDAAKRDRSGAMGRVASGPSRHPSRLELEPDQFDRYRSRFPDRVGEVGPVIEEPEAFVIHVVLEQTEGDMRLATFAVPKVKWDTWWHSVEGRLDEKSVHVADPVDAVLPVPRLDESQLSAGSECLPDDTWDNGSLDDWPEALSQHTAVWTGTLMIVWGGGSNTGGRYDPATDTWAPNSMTNAPSPRSGHTAVWTGSQMIVWGGSGVCSTPGTGARYDPTSDTWTPTSTINAPSLRVGHTAVWTGSRMIVWGGECTSTAFNTGSRYDPTTNTWAPISSVDAPSPRGSHTAVWTGSLMVVWGGIGSGSYLNTGGRYDPAADAWKPTSMTDAPASRLLNTAVWTGGVMIVWGGSDGFSYLNTGGRYDPVIDSWTPTSTTDATPRGSHTAVWTGSQMVVWGGFGSPSLSGGRYDPTMDAWVPTSTTNAPSPRTGHSAVWTGSLMVVWGGISGGSALSTGGRYDPTADTWTPTSDTTAPSARDYHSAVWTGSQMVVWGGEYFSQQNTGGRYDPATDIWMPTSTTNAPSRRSHHTAVWTGRHMVVWGGDCRSGGLDTGARYDPVADTWTAASTMDAPSPRCDHTAVWTGSVMVVWGGYDGFSYLNTGGRYDPAADSWAPTSATNAPSPRSGHTAIWTGSRIVVWGGDAGGSSSYFNTGGRYDPAADRWTATSTMDAPSPRSGHTAVWNGSLMVVWGGLGQSSELDTGSRYDPTTDTWTATSMIGAPSARLSHTVVWTGSLMVIWGGQNLLSSLSTGGRYDPTTDAWAATSEVGAPSHRSFHTAVWTGSSMVVWGGSRLRTGGKYALGHSVDDDLDGFSECQGDCDDGNAMVYVGAAEVCDGLDNNCDGTTDNAPVPAERPLLTAELSGDASHLSWAPVGQATGYYVVRGDLSTLICSGGDFASATQACLADNLGDTFLGVADPPAVGAGFWYLTRAVNCGGNGTYDSGGSGQLRPRDGGINASPSSCP